MRAMGVVRTLRARVLVVGSILALAACGAPPPDTLGVRDGVLAPCPAASDCVHTGLRHPDGTRGLFVRGSIPRGEIVERIRAVVEEMPRATVVTANRDYLHVEFRSRIFRLVDDLEISIDPAREAVVRSAARRSFGSATSNVRRVEELRRRLDEAAILR